MKPFYKKGSLCIYNNESSKALDALNNDKIKVDCVITSPPYFNAKEYSQYESISKYMDVMKDIFSKVHKILNESRMCVINISPILIPREKRSKQSYRIPLPFYFVPMMEDIGFEFLEDIIWKKPDGAAANRNGGFYRHRKPLAYKPNIVTEYILVFKKKSNKILDKFIKNESLVDDGYERTNVWEFNPETKSSHPAPFPIELPDKCIKYYSYENDVVLDPFMGSGTTGLASLNNNRKFVGIDYNHFYYRLAKERILLKGVNYDKN